MTTSPTEETPATEGAPSTKVSRKDFEAQAVALYLRGATGDEIAAAVGLPSGRGATRAAERALALGLQTSPEVNRAVDVARTNAAITALWPRVEAGQPEAAAALAALLSVRAQLLGLSNSPSVEEPADAVAAPRATRTRRSSAKPAEQAEQVELPTEG